MPPNLQGPVFGTFTESVCPRNASRLRCLSAPRLVPAQSGKRTFSSSSRTQQESWSQAASRPRWAHTPERMKAPVSLQKHNPENRYECNENPQKLDAIYARVLGEGGDRLLTEEVKWLAVTHKSFDQGRRGYNDRLAFLGKRIVNLQASLALLNRPDRTLVALPDEYEREPFRHPGIDLLPRLTEEARHDFLAVPRVASMAHNLGLMSVVRWKPRKAHDLVQSGGDQVLAQALYAIVGAVALQRGGEVAVRIVRDRILNTLGLTV